MYFKIYCDEGFGNRMGCLLGGLYISKILGRTPVINWKETSFCGLSLNDLYDIDYKTETSSYRDFFEKNEKYTLISTTDSSIHKNIIKDFNYDIKLINKINLENFMETIEFCLKNNRENIIYNNNWYPSFFPHNDILLILSTFKIKKYIFDYIDNFCKSKNINKNTWGIHLRKTDTTKYFDENEIENFINLHPNTNFFICSDCKDTEFRFSKFKNVVINPKQNYVEKLNKDANWIQPIIDSEGRPTIYNVNRSKYAVLEGFLDLLILSKTTIKICHEHSTFLQICKLYQHFEDLPTTQ